MATAKPKTAAVKKTKLPSSGFCKPGKWCAGLHALLDANVNGGVDSSLRMNLDTGKTTVAIVHGARIGDEKKRRLMMFSFCPCCGKNIDNKP